MEKVTALNANSMQIEGVHKVTYDDQTFHLQQVRLFWVLHDTGMSSSCSWPSGFQGSLQSHFPIPPGTPTALLNIRVRLLLAPIHADLLSIPLLIHIIDLLGQLLMYFDVN